MDAFIFLVQAGFYWAISNSCLLPTILENVTRSCKSVTYVVEVSGLGRLVLLRPLVWHSRIWTPFFTRNEKEHLWRFFIHPGKKKKSTIEASLVLSNYFDSPFDSIRRQTWSFFGRFSEDTEVGFSWHWIIFCQNV